MGSACTKPSASRAPCRVVGANSVRATAARRRASRVTRLYYPAGASAARKRGLNFNSFAGDGDLAQILGFSRRHQVLVDDDANERLQVALPGQEDVVESVVPRQNLERRLQIRRLDVDLRLVVHVAAQVLRYNDFDTHIRTPVLPQRSLELGDMI